jgi:hypothetical protein
MKKKVTSQKLLFEFLYANSSIDLVNINKHHQEIKHSVRDNKKISGGRYSTYSEPEKDIEISE